MSLDHLHPTVDRKLHWAVSLALRRPASNGYSRTVFPQSPRGRGRARLSHFQIAARPVTPESDLRKIGKRNKVKNIIKFHSAVAPPARRSGEISQLDCLRELSK
ncbi:hypothetical protein EVAR_76645_1 [Eumeta japonica]|uniref:Uncharacterized protein n=1 Tax=Eumeta variegata TaxID=151549 RepID=A0A4C1T6B8_EUMVA|nr:hypothetical protein EVAR_76645_1 [Eumeta japonica]